MKLEIISFNVRCCDDPNGHSIEERAPRLKSILDPISADVILLQEIRPKWVPEIECDYSDRYDMVLCYRSKEKPEGLITLWKKDRFTISDRGLFWFSDTPDHESMGWDEKYNCPRICSYVVLKEKVSGESFLAMNTHFGFGDNGQIKSVELIREYRNRFANLKAFVAGDFNMTRKDRAYSVMTKHFYDVNEATARDLRDTFHNYDPSVKRNTHIDFIFCDRKISAKSFRILDETVNGKFPSDHFGIYSELLL